MQDQTSLRMHFGQNGQFYSPNWYAYDETRRFNYTRKSRIRQGADKAAEAPKRRAPCKPARNVVSGAESGLFSALSR